MEEWRNSSNFHKRQASFKVNDGYFIACKAGSNIPTIFVGVDGSYIGQ